MDEENYSAANSIFDKGPWLRKKRYEEEEFTFSPPSDDSGFLPLKLGLQQNKVAHESMYDRINQELGFMEVSKSQSTTGSLAASNSLTASLLFGSGKITFETEPSTSHGQQRISIKPEVENIPKIFIPPTIKERRESQSESSNIILNSEERPEDSRVAKEDAATLISKARSGRPTRKISMNLEESVNRKALLENFQAFSITSTESLPTSTTEEDSGTNTSPATAPHLTLPFIEDKLVVSSGFQERRQKISAPPILNPMTMEKSSNYFFTGGLFSSIHPQVTPSNMTSSSEVIETRTSAVMRSNFDQFDSRSQNSQLNTMDQSTLSQATSMMNEGAREALVIEPKAKMGKRRPKPSALREMNFWAPQSM